jgi:hypothetical protein
MINHQTHMRTTRRQTLILTTLLAASSGMLPLHAQEACLAQLRSTSDHIGTSLPAEPISDDGDDLFTLHPASPLLITFTGTSEGTVTVQVFNGSGDLVLHRSVPAREGRQLLALDVDGLASGRYLVRVQEGAAVSTSRFMRP